MPLAIQIKYPARNAKFVSYRAISLVSCRAVAILIKSLSRGIPPSLISRGQYLSATKQEQVAEDGWPSTGLCPTYPPCFQNCSPKDTIEQGQAMSAQPPGSTWTGERGKPLGKALPYCGPKLLVSLEFVLTNKLRKYHPKHRPQRGSQGWHPREVCRMTQVPREFWTGIPWAAACIYDIVSKIPPGTVVTTQAGNIGVLLPCR